MTVLNPTHVGLSLHRRSYLTASLCGDGNPAGTLGAAAGMHVSPVVSFKR